MLPNNICIFVLICISLCGPASAYVKNVTDVQKKDCDNRRDLAIWEPVVTRACERFGNKGALVCQQACYDRFGDDFQGGECRSPIAETFREAEQYEHTGKLPGKVPERRQASCYCWFCADGIIGESATAFEAYYCDAEEGKCKHCIPSSQDDCPRSFGALRAPTIESCQDSCFPNSCPGGKQAFARPLKLHITQPICHQHGGTGACIDCCNRIYPKTGRGGTCNASPVRQNGYQNGGAAQEPQGTYGRGLAYSLECTCWICAADEPPILNHTIAAPGSSHVQGYGQASGYANSGLCAGGILPTAKIDYSELAYLMCNYPGGERVCVDYCYSELPVLGRGGACIREPLYSSGDGGGGHGGGAYTIVCICWACEADDHH